MARCSLSLMVPEMSFISRVSFACCLSFTREKSSGTRPDILPRRCRSVSMRRLTVVATRSRMASM